LEYDISCSEHYEKSRADGMVAVTLLLVVRGTVQEKHSDVVFMSSQSRFFAGLMFHTW